MSGVPDTNSNPSEYAGWRLRPVQQSDYPLIYEWAMHPLVNHRWTTRGSLIPYEPFVQHLWDDVLFNLLVAPPRRDVPSVWTTISNFDLHSGYCSLSTVARPSSIGSGVGLIGGMLTIRYIFAIHPIRKVYLETPSFAAISFESTIGKLFKLEGTLKDHLYFNGRHWDKLILALTRDEWDDRVCALTERMASRSASVASA